MKYIIWFIVCGIDLFVIPALYLVGLAWHFNHKRATKFATPLMNKIADFTDLIKK